MSEVVVEGSIIDKPLQVWVIDSSESFIKRVFKARDTSLCGLLSLPLACGDSKTDKMSYTRYDNSDQGNNRSSVVSTASKTIGHTSDGNDPSSPGSEQSQTVENSVAHDGLRSFWWAVVITVLMWTPAGLFVEWISKKPKRLFCRQIWWDIYLGMWHNGMGRWVVMR
jgi:hypothetical protein